MKNRLVILGSGTCNLIPEKAAASVLIEKDGLRLVYDFGRGVSIRLAELGFKQDDIRHVFISHFHPDHVTDFYPYLHAASWSQIDKRTQGITFYGPPGTKEFLSKLFAVFGESELGRGFSLAFLDVADGRLELENQAFDVVDLHHSYGLRFGSCAIAGDADVNDDLIRLLNRVKLGVFDAGHITDEEIVEVAVRTQAETLVCSHQYRSLDEEGLNQNARARGYVGRLVVAHDLMEFEP